MTSSVAACDHDHPAPGGAARRAGGRPWLAPVGVGVAAIAGCVAVGAFQGDSGPTTCPFRAVTGLDCPGCGMTRGLSNLVRGHPATAVDFNLLLVVALPLVAYLYLVWLASTVGRPLPLPRPGARTYAAAAAAVVAFSVVRNLPIGVGRYLNSDPTR